MSVSTVVEEIHLVGAQIFDHTAVIQKEIEKFVNSFERNKRHKEFDGIIRASHSLVEAADAPLENLQAVDDLKKLNEQLVQTTAALNGLVVPTYKKEHEDYLEMIRSTQQKQKDIVEAAIKQERESMKSFLGNSSLP